MKLTFFFFLLSNNLFFLLSKCDKKFGCSFVLNLKESFCDDIKCSLDGLRVSLILIAHILID